MAEVWLPPPTCASTSALRAASLRGLPSAPAPAGVRPPPAEEGRTPDGLQGRAAKAEPRHCQRLAGALSSQTRGRAWGRGGRGHCPLPHCAGPRRGPAAEGPQRGGHVCGREGERTRQGRPSGSTENHAQARRLAPLPPTTPLSHLEPRLQLQRLRGGLPTPRLPSAGTAPCSRQTCRHVPDTRHSGEEQGAGEGRS